MNMEFGQILRKSYGYSTFPSVNVVKWGPTKIMAYAHGPGEFVCCNYRFITVRILEECNSLLLILIYVFALYRTCHSLLSGIFFSFKLNNKIVRRCNRSVMRSRQYC
jgi:hypothetical protein